MKSSTPRWDILSNDLKLPSGHLFVIVVILKYALYTKTTNSFRCQWSNLSRVCDTNFYNKSVKNNKISVQFWPSGIGPNWPQWDPHAFGALVVLRLALQMSGKGYGQLLYLDGEWSLAKSRKTMQGMKILTLRRSMQKFHISQNEKLSLLSHLPGRPLRINLMSRYICFSQNGRYDVSFEELFSKVQNPGGFFRKNVF